VADDDDPTFTPPDLPRHEPAPDSRSQRERRSDWRENIKVVGFKRDVENYLSQWILISFSNALNSGSPVRSSEFLILASAAAKQSA